MTLSMSHLETRDQSKSLGMEDAIDGIAKAWANINATGVIAARDSLNISSLTDVQTGVPKFNFSSFFANNGYCFTSAIAQWNHILGSASTQIASSCQLTTANSAYSAIDVDVVAATMFGDLA